MPGEAEIERLLVRIGGNNKEFVASATSTIALMSAMEIAALGVGAALAVGVTVPLAMLGNAAVDHFASFDDAMVQSTAIMGDLSESVIDSMEQQALSLSRVGVSAADDLAESYFFLASAGLTAQQSMAALPQVQAFAAAGAFDLATATDLATDAQSALGLASKDPQENLKNLTRITDVLVAANTKANASVEQFSRALTRKAGTALRAVGKELEEGVAVLAVYADQGIKGANAGEKLTTFLREAQVQARQNESAFKKLNVVFHDSTGELLPMGEMVRSLESAFVGMSTQQREAALATLGFRAEAQAAILPLLGMSERLTQLTDDFKDVNGIVREVADKQMQSFSAQVKIMHNNLAAVAIDIGAALVPVLRLLNKAIIGLVTIWFSMNKHVRTFIVILGVAAAAIGPLLVGLVLAKVAFLLFSPIIIAAAASLFAFAFTAVPAAVGSLLVLRNSATLAAPPILLIAGASGAAAVGMWSLATAAAVASAKLLIIVAIALAIVRLIVGADGMSEAFRGMKETMGIFADSGVDDMKRLQAQIAETMGGDFSSKVTLAGTGQSTNFSAAEVGSAEAFRQARISEQNGTQTDSVQRQQLAAMQEVATNTASTAENQPEKPVSPQQRFAGGFLSLAGL